MKTIKIMNYEQLKKFDSNQDGFKLLTILINRPLFDKNGLGLTLEQAIQSDSLISAQNTINELNRNITIQSKDIIEKIIARSVSWNYQDFVAPYQNQNDLNSLLDISSNEENETKQSSETKDVARQWWANTIGYETRAAIKRQKSSIDKKLAYQQEVFIIKTKQLQKEPDPQYGDTYNRLVCEQANQTNSTDLILAKQQVDSQINSQITDTEIVNMLSNKEYLKQTQRLSRLLEIGMSKFNNSEKAVNFAAILYELDKRKTDNTWEQKNKLQEIIFRGLTGNSIKLITMLCTINEFDYQGGYKLNPDLNAYQKNPKVEPVPLIIDEMAQIVSLFKFYGINCSLTMYVADTDYTEIGANGSVTTANLLNLKQYMGNLSKYITKFDKSISITTISSVTDNNELYATVKNKVMECVSKRKDVDFNRIWGQKWEDDTEKRCETFSKKKLCPPIEVRKKSLLITQNIWAVNAAQGAVFSSIGPNTILLSTERRDRDANYIVDSQSTANFPPVLYVLNAAENWNRKITNKSIFETS